MASSGDRKLLGKVALVTGGSRGIGKAVAAAYAREGASVFVNARHGAELDRAVADITAAGGEIDACAGDVGNAGDVKRVVEAAVRRYGALHILVNNASVLGPRVAIADYPLELWEEVVRINLTGLFLVTQEVLKVMVAQGQGSIVNVSSGVGRFGKPRWGAYAVSKFGVEGLTQVLASELTGSGIRVNSVNPGATRTAMRARAYPEENPQTLPAPEEITEVFVYLASDEAAAVTGQSLDAQQWRRRGN